MFSVIDVYNFSEPSQAYIPFTVRGELNPSRSMSEEVPLLGSSRLALCLMNLMALLVMCLLEVSLSLSMVCMVRKPDSSDDVQQIKDNTSKAMRTWSALNTSVNHNISLLDNELSTKSSTVSDNLKLVGEFEWTRSFEGFVLSSFFYGNITTILLGGWLAGRFGGKHVIGVGLMVSSICTMLIPSAVRINKYLIIVLRVIAGMALGPVPAVGIALGGLWYPPHERSFLVSLSCAGITLGTNLAFQLPAQLCNVQFDNGWPLTFYVTGGAGLITWILWNYFAYSSPVKHPRISQPERVYLVDSIGIQHYITEVNFHKVRETAYCHMYSIGIYFADRTPFPWFRALSSSAVWAILCAHIANAWFVFTALTMVPLYFDEILHFDIKQNGLWLVIPHILNMLMNVPSGILADTIIKRNIYSVLVTRKVFQLASSWISSVLLIGVALTNQDQRYLSAVLLTLIIPIQTLCRSGYVANCIDIAPRYSGEIYSLSNTFGMISGILSPIVAGSLTTNGTKQEWQTVFFIASAILFSGGLIFLLFSDGSVLSWVDDIAAVDNITLVNQEDDSPVGTALRRDVIDYKSTTSSDASVLYGVPVQLTSARSD